LVTCDRVILRSCMMIMLGIGLGIAATERTEESTVKISARATIPIRHKQTSPDPRILRSLFVPLFSLPADWQRPKRLSWTGQFTQNLMDGLVFSQQRGNQE
jgi:hypothetical protein